MLMATLSGRNALKFLILISLLATFSVPQQPQENLQVSYSGLDYSPELSLRNYVFRQS